MRFPTTLPAFVLLLAAGAHGQDESSAASVSGTPTPTAATAGSDESPTAGSDGSATITASTTSSSPTFTGYPDSDLDPTTRCRQDQIVAGPFCSPKPHDIWRTDGNYYVTWDNDRWDLNSTVYLALNYGTPGKAGRLAEEFEFPNSRGFFTIHPKEDWLLNQTLRDEGTREHVVNQTLYFIISCDDVATPGARGPFTGPNITLTSQPHAQPINTSPNNRPAPSFLGLAVGLPLMFAFILVGVCGTHFCMRNRRQIGPIHIGGGARRFRKGYSGRAARRQRTAAAADGGATYRDEPEDISEEGTLPPAAPGRDWELASVKGGRGFVGL